MTLTGRVRLRAKTVRSLFTADHLTLVLEVEAEKWYTFNGMNYVGESYKIWREPTPEELPEVSKFPSLSGLL
jgi:hypothetical protein